MTLTILSVVAGKGRQHDFSVLKDSCLLLHPDALLLADLGYQGMHKLHQNSALPIKNKKGRPLSAEDKAHNKALPKQRIFIEPINRRCKIFQDCQRCLSGQAQELLADMESNGGSC